nr:SDR family NAD(P)-dependent oxidoreductase [uncultured Draconibacterium sp.]
MENKTCLITGANSGIGKQAAIQLAKAGFRVFVGARNRERGLRALKDIKMQSKSDAVELLEIDLSSKKSIKDAASELKERLNHLDVLIHNAADFDIARKEAPKSVDGIETIWATNHIGPVLLTNLTLDLLKESEQGRIITIASKGLLMHPNLTVDLKDPEFNFRKFSVPKAYYQSKLAQIMYTYWLADQLKNTTVTANCIRVTNVKVDVSRYPDISAFMKWVYKLKSKSALSPEEMAQTYTWLAVAPELANITGKYFNEKKQEVQSSAYSRGKENIEALMNLSMQYIK